MCSRLSAVVAGFALVTAIVAAKAHAQSSIAIDERLAAAAHLGVGDRVVLTSEPDVRGDTFVVGAITRRGADPSEVARDGYRVRLHLGDLQRLLGAGDRVSRFAVASTDPARTLARINSVAFGFRAYPSAEIAVRTSKTFRVLRRFHAAIGVITIVASAIFLLCILLLKVDERRRDIAALRLMGVSRTSVITMVVCEAALISLVGTAFGALVGWVGSLVINWHYQGVYQTPLTFSLVTPGILGFAAGLSILLGLGAGLAAATRLVRRPPLALLGR
ncbi:MAG TPA: FtsX-like permease family protein [Gemmatimonadaceae bacterium]|nr:FtsX-like permease family protein [Gemmatimonadaceae bacterium]